MTHIISEVLERCIVTFSNTSWSMSRSERRRQ